MTTDTRTPAGSTNSPPNLSSAVEGEGPLSPSSSLSSSSSAKVESPSSPPLSSLRPPGSEGVAPAIDLVREGRRDTCGALKDFWYVACLASELGTEKPIGRTILETPLALYRDAQGKPRAVRDRCLHRGAALSAGVVVDGTLCCPYHGWSYGPDGACVHIPSLGPAQRGAVLSDDDHHHSGLKLAPSEVGCLPTFGTREQDGLIYVYLGDDVEAARSPPFRVPFKDDAGWTVYFMVTPFENGVTNLVENFMDVPHTVFVHKRWFRNPAQKEVPALVERKAGRVKVTYQQEGDAISGLGFILNPSGKPMVHTDEFIVPNITRVDYLFGETSGFVINSQVTPVGPTSSMVYTAISYKLPLGPLSRGLGKVLEPLIHWYTRQVITQDTDIMAIQKRGLTAPSGEVVDEIRFTSTEADLLHADIERYRRWLLDGGEGDGPPVAARTISFWI